eukprot:7619972-Alexandrium_andersonii.AAC.1
MCEVRQALRGLGEVSQACSWPKCSGGLADLGLRLGNGADTSTSIEPLRPLPSLAFIGRTTST